MDSAPYTTLHTLRQERKKAKKHIVQHCLGNVSKISGTKHQLLQEIDLIIFCMYGRLELSVSSKEDPEYLEATKLMRELQKTLQAKEPMKWAFIQVLVPIVQSTLNKPQHNLELFLESVFWQVRWFTKLEERSPEYNTFERLYLESSITDLSYVSEVDEEAEAGVEPEDEEVSTP